MSIRAVIGVMILLAGALAITYTWAPRAGVALTPVAERHAAPEVSFKDAIGTQVKLSDYHDQVVLLNFWATWCPPCRTEIPWFVEFEEKYKPEGFAVIGISFDEEGWDVMAPFVAEQGMNYRLAWAGDANLPKPFADITALPTTVLIDRQGRIAATHEGLVSKETYETSIAELLHPSPAPQP